MASAMPHASPAQRATSEGAAMFSPTRFLVVGMLGLSLAFVASAQPGTEPEYNPAVAQIIKLAGLLDQRDVSIRAKNIVKEFDSCDISTVFRPRKAGGAGIGSAVHAGHKDSIEFLVRDWSTNKPP